MYRQQEDSVAVNMDEKYDAIVLGTGLKVYQYALVEEYSYINVISRLGMLFVGDFSDQ